MSKRKKTAKIRKVKSSNWIYETFRFPNPFGDKMLVCDASLERDFVLKKLFDTNVIYIDSKPQSFFSKTIGQRYTRDIVTGTKDFTLDNTECKPKSALGTVKNQKKFSLLKNEFKENKARFEIATEDDIYNGDEILNLKTLYPYRSVAAPSPEHIDVMLTRVEAHPKYSLGELISESKISCFSVRDIWYCLAHKRLLTDLTHRITHASIIWSENDQL